MIMVLTVLLSKFVRMVCLLVLATQAVHRFATANGIPDMTMNDWLLGASFMCPSVAPGHVTQNFIYSNDIAVCESRQNEATWGHIPLMRKQ